MTSHTGPAARGPEAAIEEAWALLQRDYYSVGSEARRTGMEVAVHRHRIESAALHAVAPSDGAGGLDVAWTAAQAALPEGWVLEVGDWRAEPNRPEGIAPFEAIAEPYVKRRDGTDPMVIGRSHDSPAAALLALAAALQDTP